MRVARAPDAARKAEGDALLRANGAQPRHERCGLFGTYALLKALAVWDALGGGVGVEVEGPPDDGEGVGFAVGVDFLVEADGFVEALFADVALVG